MSGRVDTESWETPPHIFGALHREFGFTLDAASSAANAKLPKYITKDQDGLRTPWKGERVWVNPPYGRGDVVGRWVRKAFAEVSEGGCQLAVLLVPARTETAWFHEIALPFGEVRLVYGRIRFSGAPKAGRFPSLVLVLQAPLDLARAKNPGLRPNVRAWDPPGGAPQPDLCMDAAHLTLGFCHICNPGTSASQPSADEK